MQAMAEQALGQGMAMHLGLAMQNQAMAMQVRNRFFAPVHVHVVVEASFQP